MATRRGQGRTLTRWHADWVVWGLSDPVRMVLFGSIHYQSEWVVRRGHPKSRTNAHYRRPSHNICTKISKATCHSMTHIHRKRNQLPSQTFDMKNAKYILNIAIRRRGSERRTKSRALQRSLNAVSLLPTSNLSWRPVLACPEL